MNDMRTLEAFPSPNHKMGFLLDWLVTLKCNFDCTYCSAGGPGEVAGHDNSQKHPEKQICEKMLKQGLRYVDAYMEIKKPSVRIVTLNVSGGEALYHPDIESMFEKSSLYYEEYKDKWILTRKLTTNASASEQKWKNVSEHLDYVTFSYHSQGPAKFKDNFLRNLEISHNAKKKYQVIVLMYPGKWQDCCYMLEYLTRKGYNVRPRLIDGPHGVYNREQLEYLSGMWGVDEEITGALENKKIVDKGRACCGGRPLCVNRNYKVRQQFVPRQDFLDWYCSANHFFLMMDSHQQKFFTTRDCSVRDDGTRGHIADVNTMNAYIEKLKVLLANNNSHFLKCVQQTCRCGTCAPKSQTRDGLIDMMSMYNNTKNTQQ